MQRDVGQIDPHVLVDDQGLAIAGQTLTAAHGQRGLAVADALDLQALDHAGAGRQREVGLAGQDIGLLAIERAGGEKLTIEPQGPGAALVDQQRLGRLAGKRVDLDAGSAQGEGHSTHLSRPWRRASSRAV